MAFNLQSINVYMWQDDKLTSYAIGMINDIRSILLAWYSVNNEGTMWKRVNLDHKMKVRSPQIKLLMRSQGRTLSTNNLSTITFNTNKHK